MTPQKIVQRKQAMRAADAVNKIEGAPVRNLCNGAFERLERGENHRNADERGSF